MKKQVMADIGYVWGRRALIAMGLVPVAVATYHLVRNGDPVFAYYARMLSDVNAVPVAETQEELGHALFMSHFLVMIVNLVTNGIGGAFIVWYALKPGGKLVWWAKAVLITMVGVVDSLAVFVLFLRTGSLSAIPFIPLVVAWIALLATKKKVFSKPQGEAEVFSGPAPTPNSQ